MPRKKKRARAVSLTDVELAVVLAGLRLAQIDLKRLASMPHFEDVKVPTFEEIDDLAQYLNAT